MKEERKKRKKGLSETDTEVVNEKFGAPIVVYGGNLTEEQKKSVRESLKITDKSDVQEIVVTGKD